jgi:hypothetical protein
MSSQDIVSHEMKSFFSTPGWVGAGLFITGIILMVVFLNRGTIGEAIGILLVVGGGLWMWMDRMGQVGR